MIVFWTSVAGSRVAPVSDPVELIPPVVAPAAQTPLKVAVSERLLATFFITLIETISLLVVAEKSFWDALSALTRSLAWGQFTVRSFVDGEVLNEH